MEITIEDIQNMSDAEVAELNKKLGLKIIKRIAIFQIAKWIVILGVTHAVRAYLDVDDVKIKK